MSEKKDRALQVYDPAESDHSTPDPFVVDMETLRSMTSERAICDGVNYFKEHRVTEVFSDVGYMEGLVEGSRPDDPYRVEVEAESGGNLRAMCECDNFGHPLCKHAVAVLIYYGAHQPTSEMQLRNAADKAVEERIKRAKTQVVCEHVSGEPWFGGWSARSVNVVGVTARTYQVQIRAVEGRMNYCSCPDYAANRLGTCKHIEAVIHKLRKKYKRGKKALQSKQPLHSFVYLAWDVEDAPRIRIYRTDNMSRGLARIVGRFFDPDGFFTGKLPSAFFDFQKQVYGWKSIMVGPDTVLHAQRMAEEQARRAAGQTIYNRIRLFGGRLEGVSAHLYPYQMEGTAFLASRGRALLADDMGLGKTLQAIAAAEWLMQTEGVRRVLVVCPASLKHQWAREIERFTKRDVEVISGGVRSRRIQYRKQASFTVMNYELVRNDIHTINEDLSPDLLVLDEAQRIKNWRTKTAAVIKMLETSYAFVLTGTPLENRLEDLYSVMQVIDDRILGPLWQYMIDFHITDERGKAIGYRNLSELRRRLAPVMLRRDRRLVRDQLPSRINHRLDVPLSKKQREIHDGALSMTAKFAAIIKKRPLTPSEERRLMAALQQARMACDAEGLIDKKTEGSAKLNELSVLLESACLEQGRKVVVFSEWERMTAMAERQARKLGLKTVRLHGGVPTGKRGKLLDKFYNDDEALVFLSTDAGGVGLNLQCANVLINLDVPWNPAVLEQRIGRVHRLGQKEPVEVVVMVGERSYEERVLELVTAKRELFDNVMSPEAAEDVVGISRRNLEILAEAATEDSSEDRPEDKPEDRPAAAAAETAAGFELALNAAVETATEAAAAGTAAETAGPQDTQPSTAKVLMQETGLSSTDEHARKAVTALQEKLGSRLNRVMATPGGLLAVVDGVDDVVEAVTESVSDGIKVAAIDERSLASLERLGAASQLYGKASLDTGERRAEEKPAENPLLTIVQRKTRAAEVLLREGLHGECLALLMEAMLATAALRANHDSPPDARCAAVWLYSECVPKGYLSHQDAAAITRAQALAAAPDIPAELVRDVLGDARRLASL